MKRALWLSAAAVAALASACLAATVTVVMRETKVRQRPGFLGRVLGAAKLGDAFEAGEAKDGWLPVTFKGRRGWVHQSAVTARQPRVRAGKWEGEGEATSDEVTLAGKGFNDRTERDYRAQNASLDFSGVDAMQEREAGHGALARFMAEGRLVRQEEER